MVIKGLKYGAVTLIGALVFGGLIFGGDVFSYLRTSTKQVRKAVKDSVSVEFELQRARDMVEEILPELQANIRLIAQEEVEISALKKDIAHSEKLLKDERKRVAMLRKKLTVHAVSYRFDDQDFSRQHVKEELAKKFDFYKEAEMILAGKTRLLKTRENSIKVSLRALQKTRTEKVHLEQQISSLTAQFRLVQAASAGSKFSIDKSKLTRSHELIGDIKKRLDIAERVLNHESLLTEGQEIPVDVVNETDLLKEVDKFLTEEESTDEIYGLEKM